MSVLKTLQTADLSKDFHAQLIACLPHLRAYARVITGNRDLADDLVHDAVVRALAASHQFQPGTNFKAWLFTILRNQNTSNFRKNRMVAIPLEEISEDVYQAQPNQEERLTLKELERAVKALPRHRREALSLIVVHGFSYEEAAKVCRCAVGTIKSRVARARTELYDRLLGSDEETREETRTAPGETGTLVSQGGVGGDIESQSRRKAASRATPQAFVERWPGMFARSR